MQHCYLFLVTLALFLFSPPALFAKIAIVGHDSGGSPDQFAFVSDEFIAAGTVLYFSEDEYDAANDQFLIVEGIISYTVPSGGLPAGRVVIISEISSNTFSSDDGGTAVSAGGNFSLSSSMEEIYVFAASDPASPQTSATFVYCWFFIDVADGLGSNSDPSSDLTVEVVQDWSTRNPSSEYRRDRSLPTTLDDILNPDNWVFDISSYDTSSEDFTGSFTLNAGLPVSLTDFTARTEKDESVVLNWQTASEDNNAGFTVERSSGRSDWLTIGFVPGAGTSSVTRQYEFEDASVVPGSYAYRLRQNDLDGTSAYSPIRNVNLASSGIAITAYPNPVINHQLNVRLNGLLPEERVMVRLLTVAGRTVRSAQGGANVLWNTEGLPSGIYFVVVETATGTSRKKLVVR